MWGRLELSLIFPSARNVGAVASPLLFALRLHLTKIRFHGVYLHGQKVWGGFEALLMIPLKCLPCHTRIPFPKPRRVSPTAHMNESCHEPPWRGWCGMSSLGGDLPSWLESFRVDGQARWPCHGSCYLLPDAALAQRR